MVIYQGNTYNLPIRLKIKEQIIVADDVKGIEFAFGEVKKPCVIKTYPEQATFDGDKFLCPLTQEDTFLLDPKKTKFQIRVKFNDGSVKSTGTQAVNVVDAISNEVLK